MTLRLSLLGAAALSVGALFGAGPATAQPVPSGSYQSSCNRVTVYGDTLRATCETENGDWVDSRLDNYDGCEGDISNENGKLSCTRGDDNRRGDRGDRGDDQAGGVPPGSYQESCQNERVESGDLLAECADRNGRSHHSELENYRRCRDDINNDNGVLRCGQGEAGGDDLTVPTGTWRATCRDYRVTRNKLFAECRDNRGRWLETSVDLRNCRLGVSNVNGDLVCNVPVPPVPVGWRISVYRDVGYRGTGRTFTGDVADLANYGLANTLSSAYLRSGAWQVCTRTYYRGQCAMLRFSAPDFRRLGINDRVRSLRRVR